MNGRSVTFCTYIVYIHVCVYVRTYVYACVLALAVGHCWSYL